MGTRLESTPVEAWPPFCRFKTDPLGSPGDSDEGPARGAEPGARRSRRERQSIQELCRLSSRPSISDCRNTSLSWVKGEGELALGGRQVLAGVRQDLASAGASGAASGIAAELGRCALEASALVVEGEFRPRGCK